MEFIASLQEKAAALGKIIALPEGDDPRMQEAAVRITAAGIASVILLGKTDALIETMAASGLSTDRISFSDPETAADRGRYAGLYHEKRKHKGMTADQAAAAMTDPLFYATMMVEDGAADGMVAGAVNSTGNVLRAGFQIIGTAPGCSIVSSCFVMVNPDWDLGENGLIVMADCAVNPDPDAAQLADIAQATATTARALCGFEPRVAMLSYSTGGSGVGPSVDKVVESVRILREKAPGLKLDGPLQADAALVPEIGGRKAPDSDVAGRANVLVFPDLNSGNIGYKLVQRLSDAEAVGPVMQGMAKPINDLSRGCSVEDIVNVAAITALQSGGDRK